MIFLRFILLLVLAYYLVKILSRWILGISGGRRTGGRRTAPEKSDPRYRELTDQEIEDADFEEIGTEDR
jgi:hypothetical protein